LKGVLKTVTHEFDHIPVFEGSTNNSGTWSEVNREIITEGDETLPYKGGELLDCHGCFGEELGRLAGNLIGGVLAAVGCVVVHLIHVVTVSPGFLGVVKHGEDCLDNRQIVVGRDRFIPCEVRIGRSLGSIVLF